MKPLISVLISSRDRAGLFRRSLASLARDEPLRAVGPFMEVVVADDGSAEDTLSLLRGQPYPWTFVRCDRAAFTRETGVEPFWNCPAWTNNVAFRFAQGQLIAQMGNEIILPAGAATLKSLLADLPSAPHAWCASTTYDMPASVVAELDAEGANLSRGMVTRCTPFLLSNSNHVPNYLSLFTRGVWEATGGYDERYLAGIGAEDSDFMRRAFSLPGFKMARSPALSLHQYHGGVNHFYRPLPSVISEARLAEGVAINRVLYREWDGTVHNRQPWPAGTIGVSEVIKSENSL